MASRLPVLHQANQAPLAMMVPTVPPGSVIGAPNPATASQNSSPHPTYEEAQLDQAIITGGQAAADCPPQTYDTSAVLTPPATLPGGPAVTTPKMLFSGLYKSTKLPLSRLRQHSQPVTVEREYDPDLVSKDKAKQKEAVRRFLAARIRNDWVFNWPVLSKAEHEEDSASEDPVIHTETLPVQQPAVSEDEKTDGSALSVDDDDEGYHCDDDGESIYSTVSEDPIHFCPRAEWLSDLSGDENDEPCSPSAYRFDSPDAVGSTVQATELTRNAKRRRAVRAEMGWNSGLACFNARRDAWTSAKVARVRPKPAASTTTSPTTRRLSFWRLSSSTSPSSPTDSPTELSPSATRNSGDTTAVSSLDSESKELKVKEDSSQYPVQTLLPVPPPLLPAENPMRASITPASYAAIYDKIVVHALTPACPVNLGDVLRACVVGWKRDGEWPPRVVEAAPVVAVRKKKRKDSNGDKRLSMGRRLSFNLLGRRLSAGGDPSTVSASPAISKQDDATTTKGVKRSLQRVLGLGQDKTSGIMSNSIAS
ncbi:hypothetical protein HD806DRAFT_225264 [Xylariaceae sp. AK1471]|nr:hypothetical protein HD806DRAFT_225264 [Xylariaceae sp. AK1471]